MNRKQITTVSSDEMILTDSIPNINYRIHRISGSRILACCDEDLIGKKLTGVNTVVNIDRAFYGSEVVPITLILNMIPGVNSMNAIGKNIIDHLLNNRIIMKDQIQSIGGVPHIQIYFI